MVFRDMRNPIVPNEILRLGLARKTALVLSAGGMFGAYQAGAWQALAPVFQPDLVVGASIGALNGWSIAGGAAPGELIRRWLDRTASRFASFRLLQPPWLGAFDARPLHAAIEDIWGSYKPRVPVGVVAVDLASLEPRLFCNDEITWRHLAASCAVLTCYPQIKLGGRYYTDGGLLNSLPLWAAAQMGAERIVALVAMREVPSRLVRAAVGGFRAVARWKPQLLTGVEVITIAPARSLGPLRQGVFWQEGAVKRWIEQGQSDAAAVMEGTGWTLFGR